MAKRRNRLIFEKSPYLLQHAYNPVDWYPWDDEAFQKARHEDKPIFLSIGYSTCHWCHVMAHESFEDEMVARLMNDVFVSIKVDREERPDIDQTYMAVSQALTGSGGWPLNVIMTPDKKPFFAATYIPKESMFGRVGMLDLVPRIKVMWKTQHGELLESADHITATLQQAPPPSIGVKLDKSVLKDTYSHLVNRFDSVHGGFGSAPKFPSPHTLFALLRYWRRSDEEGALMMVEMTLQAMRRGGLYDHLGFGFHRYSTDEKWLLPHFEKMLYDQAMASLAYLETYLATGKEEYGRVAREIFAYVLRDMTSKEGGFHSAEDADSEGEEGKFYLWTEDEIKEVLDLEEADLAIQVFGVRKDGNFAEEASGRKTKRNVLHMKESLREAGASLGIGELELGDQLENIRQKLFEAREKRVHPDKDDKILTDWNGMMIAALSRGAQALDEPEYEAAARKAADFLLAKMRDQDGRLLHRYRDGDAAIRANLDDYAFLIWGLIELYETSFHVPYLEAALHLNCDLIDHFLDEENGGFYFTPEDGEGLILRRKEMHDGAVPSGNSVALLNLLRLARMTGNPNLENLAAKMIQSFSSEVKGLPAAYLNFMVALDFSFGPSSEVVIAGPSGSEYTQNMLKALRSRFLPNKVVLLKPTEEGEEGEEGENGSPEIVNIAEFTKPLKMVEGRTTAYVCSGQVCESPTTDAGKMLENLGV